MSVIKELDSVDTLQNKIFRVVAVPILLNIINKKLVSMWQSSSVDNLSRAKNISKIQESIAYEEFPVLSTVIRAMVGI